MHTDICLLNTEAGINLIELETIPKDWDSRMKRNKHLLVRTATKQSLVLDG